MDMNGTELPEENRNKYEREWNGKLETNGYKHGKEYLKRSGIEEAGNSWNGMGLKR